MTDPSAQTTQAKSPNPAIFSRGSLKLTYDLLRKVKPELALQVRNIINGEPLPKQEGAVDNKNSDYFLVELDSFQVREVVEILMQQNQSINPEENRGLAIMTNALVEDWLLLAKMMIEELMKTQSPNSAEEN